MEVLNGANRFNMLRTAVPDISPRTLSGRLDDLENTGLLRRQVASNTSSRVHYALTEKGEDMRTLLRELANFSLKWYGASHGEQSQTNLAKFILFFQIFPDFSMNGQVAYSQLVITLSKRRKQANESE